MVNVIASIHVKDGRVEEFVEIFKANVPAVLKEKGCLEYAPTVDLPTSLAPQKNEKGVVTIIEKWSTLDDLMAHQSAPHMVIYREKVKDLVDNVSVKVLREA